jgi:hypothetical protein
MIDYRELRKALKDHLKIGVNEHSHNEMEISIVFGDTLISKSIWKK